MGFPPILSLLMPTFSFLHAPPILADKLLCEQNAPLPSADWRIQSFGGIFDARLFSANGRSTSELLRTVYMNYCFQANILAVDAYTPRFIQINIHLGTLAVGLGSFPLGYGH